MARKTMDEKKDAAPPPPPPAYPYPPNMTPNYPLREKQDPAMAPLADGQPRRLHILGATWAGVVVTPQVAAMVSTDNEVFINMNDLVHILSPDPAFGIHKTLNVLYQLDGQEGPALLNITEGHPTVAFAINNVIHETSLARGGVLPGAPYPAVEQLPIPWRSSTFYSGSNNSQSPPGVEILAVTYGPKRFTTPSILEELTNFFERRVSAYQVAVEGTVSFDDDF
jgi:hypothetical protein